MEALQRHCPPSRLHEEVIDPTSEQSQAIVKENERENINLS